MRRTLPVSLAALVGTLCLVGTANADFIEAISISPPGYGASWGDCDNDGDLDLYVTRSGAPNALLRNDGNDTFVDIAAGTPLADDGPGRSAPWGDYDNDGDLDLFVANAYGGISGLLRNDGNGQFFDVTTSPLNLSSFGAAWSDYDLDGDIDLYISRWGNSNHLFRNDGEDIFSDVTSGPLSGASYCDDSEWADFDNDGDQDLYVADHNGPNALLRNDLAQGFTDVTTGPLVGSGATEGIGWGDYDTDGDLDLYFAEEFGQGTLLENLGSESFIDVTSGPLGDSAYYSVAWGDYDNDLDLDILVSPTRLIRNDGSGNFADVTAEQMPGASGLVCAPWGDYDNDGDLDACLMNSSIQIFRNDLSGDNHWLEVQLEGVVSNQAAFGARVTLSLPGSSQIREIGVGSGFCTQNAITAHFGLASATHIDTLKVAWPSGTIQIVPLVSIDNRIVVVEQPILRVPGDEPTIQAALNATHAGGIVLVAPGTYAGPDNRNLDFGGQVIELRSEAGPELTTIDCEGFGRGFHFHSGETNAALVEGFTIRNGSAIEGGGLLCSYSSPTFSTCIFSENSATGSGGAAYLNNGSAPVFHGCEFSNNYAGLGGAVACDGASVTVTSSTFHQNSAAAGSGVALLPGGSASFENTIIAFGAQGEAVFCAEPGSATLSCSDIYGNAGGDWVGCIADQAGVNGNFSADPLFCNPTIGVLTLHEDSPCASAPGCGLVGAWPVGCGTSGVPSSLTPAHGLRFSVHPNPVMSTAEFVFDRQQPATLEIYDAQGRLVDILNPVGSATWIPPRGMPSGVYFARVTSSGSAQTVRFVVLR